MSSILHILESRLAKGEKTITIREILELFAEYAAKYDQMESIFNKIYIARNISQSQRNVLTCLEEIDKLMRDKSEGN